MRKSLLFVMCGIFAIMFASCNTYKHSMREPNVRVNLTAEDVILSNQVVGEATVVRVLGIDWARLFGKSEIGESVKANRVELPIIGNINITSEASYAMYNMMQKNPGYDVVVYPQVESYRHAPILGTDLYSKSTYKVTARLGKLKN